VRNSGLNPNHYYNPNNPNNPNEVYFYCARLRVVEESGVGPKFDPASIIDLDTVNPIGSRKRKGDELTRIKSGKKGKVYRVERILAHKREGKSWLFLIKWHGFSSVNNSWEHEDAITPCAIQEYWGGGHPE